jgi:hypothetical protein
MHHPRIALVMLGDGVIYLYLSGTERIESQPQAEGVAKPTHKTMAGIRLKLFQRAISCFRKFTTTVVFPIIILPS